MKIYELMGYSAPLLRQMVNCSVHAEDVKHIPMMLRYEELKADNVKKVAIIAILSEEFGVSQRSVWDVIRRLEQEV